MKEKLKHGTKEYWMDWYWNKGGREKVQARRKIREYERYRKEKVGVLAERQTRGTLTKITFMKKVQYTKELLENIVKSCYSFAELCRKLGLKPEGSNPKTLRKKMNEFGVDYSHFTGRLWNKNSNNPVYKNKYLPKLCENSSLSSTNVKDLLYNLQLKENKCENCGLSEWCGKPIICELHHINGNSTDNRIENLQILCPNCHSQTDNFRGKNISKVMSAQKETSDVEAG